MGSPIQVTIVSVTYNSAHEISGFLDALGDLLGSTSHEVIVVDNASNDDTVSRIRDHSAVQLIASDRNLGYGRAMNAGIARARGRFVLLCNPDLIVTPETVARLQSALDADPKLGGVSPHVLTAKNEIYPVALRDPGLYYAWNFFSGLMNKFEHHRFFNWDRTDCDERVPDGLPWLHGCCGLYRKGALESIGGGFDERFFMYFEDADLGRQLNRHGWKLQLVTDCSVVHLEDRSGATAGTRTRRYFMESWHRYRRKYCGFFGRMTGVTIVTLALAFQASGLLFRRLRGRPTSFAAFRTYLAAHVSESFRFGSRSFESIPSEPLSGVPISGVPISTDAAPTDKARAEGAPVRSTISR